LLSRAKVYFDLKKKRGVSLVRFLVWGKAGKPRSPVGKLTLQGPHTRVEKQGGREGKNQ